MSEQGFGDPPETPPGGPATPPANAWQTVNPTPPPPPGYTPPPTGQYPPPGYPPPGYPPPGYGQPAVAGLSRNSAAALAYVTFIPAIIFLIMAPYSKDRFIRFSRVAVHPADRRVDFDERAVYLLCDYGHVRHVLHLSHVLLVAAAGACSFFGWWRSSRPARVRGSRFHVVGDIAMSLAGKENI